MQNQPLLSLNYVRALIAATLVMLVAALGAYTYLTIKQAKYTYTGPMMITVVGNGEVLAKPDIGQFNFGVQAEGANAGEAQTASAEAMNAILTALKEAGVAEADVKTTNYSLNPKYRYEERVCPFGTYCPPGEQIIDGYEVMQNVTVKVRDLEKSGSLLTMVGELGATNVSGLSFTIDDDEALKAQARAMAIENAKAKAEQQAEDLGVEIVRMTGYWEDENQYSPFSGYGKGGDMVMAEAAVSPDMPAGENEVLSRVNLTFEVR